MNNNNKNSSSICNNNSGNNHFNHIWNNEYIRLKILNYISVLNRYNKSYSYYESTNLLWLLKNNHINLIIDKLNKYKINNSFNSNIYNSNNSINNNNNNNQNNKYNSISSSSSIDQIYFQFNKESLTLIGNIEDNKVFEGLIDYWYENQKVYNDTNNNEEYGLVIGSGGGIDSDGQDTSSDNEYGFEDIKSSINLINEQEQNEIFNYNLSTVYILQGILKSKIGSSRLEYFLNHTALSDYQKEINKEVLLNQFEWGVYEYQYYISSNSLNYLIGEGYIQLNNNSNHNSNILKLELVKEILNKSNEIKEFDHQGYKYYYLDILATCCTELGHEKHLLKLLEDLPNITINQIKYYQEKTYSLQFINNDQLIKQLLYKLSSTSTSTNIIDTITFISSIFGIEKFRLCSNEFFSNYLYQLSKLLSGRGCTSQDKERVIQLLWYFFNNQFNINYPIFTSMVSYLGEYELLESIISTNYSNGIEYDMYLSSNALDLALLSGIPMIQQQQQQEEEYLEFEFKVDLILSKYFGHLVRVIESISQLPDDINSPSNISIELSRNDGQPLNVSILNYNYQDIQYFLDERDQLLYRQYSNKHTSDEEFLKYFKVMELLVPYVIIDETNETLAMAAGIGGNPFIVNYYLNSGNPNIDWLASTLCFFNQQDPFIHLFSNYKLSPDAYALCLNYSAYNCNSTIFKLLLEEPYYNSLDNIPHFHHLLLLPILRGSLEIVKLLHATYNQDILDTYILISILINNNNNSNSSINNNNNSNNNNSNYIKDIVQNEIKLAIKKIEYKKRNQITKYLLDNKKFKQSNALTMACYTRNEELIDFILDSNYYNFEGTTTQDNSEIEILLSNGSSIRIIEKILRFKLQHHNQNYQVFHPYIFNIAFINGHIETGELFLKSKYIDWRVNQIKSNHLSTLLHYSSGKGQLLEFILLSNRISDQELFNFYTVISIFDFTLILSNLSINSISTLLQNYNQIISRNGFKRSAATKTTTTTSSKSLSYYRHGHFIRKVIKLLILNGDLATLKRLLSITNTSTSSSISTLNKSFIKQIFIWSARFENLPIISLLYNQLITATNNNNNNNINHHNIINNNSNKKRYNNNSNHMYDENWVAEKEQDYGTTIIALDSSISNLIQHYNQNLNFILLLKSFQYNNNNNHNIIKKQKIK